MHNPDILVIKFYFDNEEATEEFELRIKRSFPINFLFEISKFDST